MTLETLDQLALSRADVDRCSERRTDPSWLAATWADPRTRVFTVCEGHALVRRTDDAAALWLTSTAEAPPGERYFLGVDPDGVAYFAVAVDALPDPIPRDGVVPAGLREVGVALNDRETGLLVHAVGLENWHRAHPRCSRCGAPTEMTCGGHVRRCPVDESEHYPRTDPAVIMAVVDSADRLLLGHHANWPTGRFSTLAGFVEPGESLEQAVAREVREETAVLVGRCDYLGSQPWPFPSSLMLGFLAHAETTEIVTDDVEIVEARWFGREELMAAVSTGEVLLPPPLSIARRLIERWYGGVLDEGRGTWR